MASQRIRSSLLVAFLSVSAFAKDDTLESQASVEAKIHSELSQKISKFVANEDFKLVVNTKVRTTRQRIILEGETQSDAKKLEIAKGEDALPGFTPPPKVVNPSPQNLNRKEKFRYVEKLVIDRVDAYLVFDTTTPEDKRAFVETLVAQEVEHSFGRRGHVVVSVMDLKPKQEEPVDSFRAWFAQYLEKRGINYLDVLYYSAIALAVLFALISMALYIRRRFVKPKAVSDLTGSMGGADARKKAGNDQRLTDQIIEIYLKEPLIAKKFLSRLSSTEKAAILKAMKTPALKQHFQQLFGVKANAALSFSGDATDTLRSILIDLQRFTKIKTQQADRQFGYVNLLPDEILRQFVTEQKDPAFCLAVLASHIDEQQYQNLTTALTQDQQIQFFRYISQGQLDVSAIEGVDASLRQIFEIERRSGDSAVTNELRLQEQFLESVDDVQTIVDRLKEHNLEVGIALEKYVLDFDGLLKVDENLLSEVFDRVPNEVLAKAFAKNDNWTDVLGISDARQKLITSMAQRFRRISDDEVKKARNLVLREYRQLI